MAVAALEEDLAAAVVAVDNQKLQRMITLDNNLVLLKLQEMTMVVSASGVVYLEVEAVVAAVEQVNKMWEYFVVVVWIQQVVDNVENMVVVLAVVVASLV